jgi:hypothetical protein
MNANGFSAMRLCRTGTSHDNRPASCWHSRAIWVRSVSLANLLEHRSMMQMAQGLIPLSPMSHPPREGPPIPWLDAGDPEPWKLRLKAGGPLLLHGLVCGWAGIAFLRLQQSGAAGTWIGDLLLGLLFTNLWLVLTSHSDLETLLSGQGALLYCGNFGLIAS